MLGIDIGAHLAYWAGVWRFGMYVCPSGYSYIYWYVCMSFGIHTSIGNNMWLPCLTSISISDGDAILFCSLFVCFYKGCLEIPNWRPLISWTDSHCMCIQIYQMLHLSIHSSGVACVTPPGGYCGSSTCQYYILFMGNGITSGRLNSHFLHRRVLIILKQKKKDKEWIVSLHPFY